MQKLRGWKIPQQFLTPKMTVIDCAGVAFLVVPEQGLCVNLEALCDRLDQPYLELVE